MEEDALTLALYAARMADADLWTIVKAANDAAHLTGEEQAALDELQLRRSVQPGAATFQARAA